MRYSITRQSISFTNPNNDWLNAQVASEEFTSKSDVVNDLIRKTRAEQEEIEFIRAKLIKAEQRGITDLTRDEILAKSKGELRHNGKL